VNCTFAHCTLYLRYIVRTTYTKTLVQLQFVVVVVVLTHGSSTEY
jgi:hypothetical protein